MNSRSVRNLYFALALLLFSTLTVAAEQQSTPKTMRVDYFHTGTATSEVFSLDRVVIEPLPWPGDLSKNIDESNLGKYFFEVRDKASSKVLYSRGFASIFGEWETTDEAKNTTQTFNESLRFPTPDAPVHITLSKRDPQNQWKKIWENDVDPKGMFVDTSAAASPGDRIVIEQNGDSPSKVDFLIIGDGYTSAQRTKCEADARRYHDILFSTPPFKEHRKDFNTWALCPAAREAGISRPSSGVHRRSPVGTSYDAFGSERYILTYDNHALRDVASYAPYEFIEVITNTNTYGGGGIFNLYSTVAADSTWAPYVFVHEFGHHFAGLADEYYTSDVSYLPPSSKVEPWEPNVTALLDPKLLKWRELVEPGTPLPTPWSKEKFENYSHSIQARRREIRKQNKPEAVMDALFNEEKVEEEKMLSSEKYARKVGAFEGANYEAKGYYRPETNCIMFTRATNFCAVCRKAIERVISLYAK